MLFPKLALGFLASATIVGSAVALFTIDFEKAPRHVKRPPKQDRIDLAIRQEVEMTRDPATGEVPRDRLFWAKNVADDLRHELLGDARSPLAQMAWAERGPSNVGGRTRAILVDASDATGKTVWAGSISGGLWRTTTGDLAVPVWQRHDDALENLAITALAQNPSTPATMYFGTGEGFFNIDAVRGAGIWKTTNGGTSWARLAATNNSNFHFIEKITVTPSGIVLAATRNGGVQRSTDGGATWVKSLGSGLFAASNRAADVEMAANGDLFAAMGIFDQDGIYKSADGGATWAKLAGGLPSQNFYRIELAAAPSDAGRVYALFQNSSNSDVLGIWATADGGATWVQKALPAPLGMTNFGRNQAWYNLAAAVDPTDANRLAIGGIDLFRSSDGGSTWSQLSHWYGGWAKPYVHADQHAIVFSGSNRLWIGNDGGIFRSLNAAGAAPSFAFAASGYNVTQYYGVDFHPAAGSPVALAGAQDNGTQRFDAADLGGAMTVAGGDGGFSHIDQNEPNIQIASYVYTNFFITRDNWATSQSLTVGQGNEGLFINVSDYDDAANSLFMGGPNNQIGWAKGLGGAAISTGFTPISIENSYLTAISVAPTTAGRLFVGTGAGEIFRIENAGAAQPLTSKIRDGLGSVSCIAVEKGNENHLLASYSNYGVLSVFETSDGGTTWSMVEGNLPDMPVRWAVFAPDNPKKALLATEIGVWTTENLDGNLTEWLPSNGGLANVRTDMVVVRPSDKLVLAATHGRGLFESSFFGQPSAGCAAPTGLLAASVSENSATLGCAADGQATGYEFRWRVLGASAWILKSSATASAAAAGLTAATNYEFQARQNCPSGWTAFSASATFQTPAAFVCQAATALTVASVTNSTAILKWSAAAGATTFDVRWRRVGTAAWTTTAAVAGNSTTISGLLATKHYEFAVKTNCGAGAASAFGAAYIFTASATATGCAAPHGFKMTPLAPTTAQIDWAQTAGSVSWIVRWKALAATAWTIQNVAAPSIALAGLAAGQSYQINVAAKCSATSQSPYSFTHGFTMPALLGCQPEGNSADEWIERVQVAQYQRVTGKNEGGYFCQMADPMALPTGQRLDFEIEPGFAAAVFAENYAIWFDANGDGIFQQTPDEALFSQPTILDSIIKGQLELPKNARPGLRHLRVMMRYNPIGSACGAMAWGECEDYLIQIAGDENEFADEIDAGGGQMLAENEVFEPKKSDETEADWAVAASPNPLHETLFLETEKAGLARLFDSKGQLLGQIWLEKGKNEWPLSFLPSGFFALVLTDGAGERRVLRVVKN